MPEQWFDYRQLGELWQMSPEAARTRARRGRFPRRVGNQGQAEVLVDTDAPVRRPRPPRAGGQSQTTTPQPTPDSEVASQATTAALAALQGHIDDLKARIAKADEQTDQLRQERDAIRQERDVERERVATLTAELLRRTGEMLDAKAKADAEAARPRSWWQRLVG